MHPLCVRILCVVANEDLSKLLSLMLGMEGFDVQVAATIEQALHMAKPDAFGLYLVDDRFPDGSGVDLIRRLRAIDKEAPIILQSSRAYAADIRAGLEAGANAYFTKPTHPDELIKGVKKLTGTWRDG